MRMEDPVVLYLCESLCVCAYYIWFHIFCILDADKHSIMLKHFYHISVDLGLQRSWCASGESGGCRFESRPRLLRTKVYSAFHPSRVSKWIPAAAGKAKAGIANSTYGWNAGIQVKLCYPLTMCAIPECFIDTSCGGAIQIDYLYLFYLHVTVGWVLMSYCSMYCSGEWMSHWHCPEEVEMSSTHMRHSSCSQGGHQPGKHGKVGELESRQGIYK